MKAAAHIKAPQQYIDSLPPDRREAIRTLHQAIREAAPTLAPHIQNGMLGYGPIHYRYASGREGDWFLVGLASQKNYISLYLCVCDDEGYLAEKYRDRLGKVSVGRSCIRFKKLEDLNLKFAMHLVRTAVQLSAGEGAREGQRRAPALNATR